MNPDTIAHTIAKPVPLWCEMCARAKGPCGCSLGLAPLFRMQLAEKIADEIRAAYAHGARMARQALSLVEDDTSRVPVLALAKTLERYACEICGGSGKRTDPIDGTVWPDDPCEACSKEEP